MMPGRSRLLKIATQPLRIIHQIADPRNVPAARAIFVSRPTVPRGVIVGAAVMKRRPVTGFEAASITPDAYVVRQINRSGADLRLGGIVPPRRMAWIPIQISSVAVTSEQSWANPESVPMMVAPAVPAVARRIHPT